MNRTKTSQNILTGLYTVYLVQLFSVYTDSVWGSPLKLFLQFCCSFRSWFLDWEARLDLCAHPLIASVGASSENQKRHSLTSNWFWTILLAGVWVWSPHYSSLNDSWWLSSWRMESNSQNFISIFWNQTALSVMDCDGERSSLSWAWAHSRRISTVTRLISLVNHHLGNRADRIYSEVNVYAQLIYLEVGWCCGGGGINVLSVHVYEFFNSRGDVQMQGEACWEVLFDMNSVSFACRKLFFKVCLVTLHCFWVFSLPLSVSMFNFVILSPPVWFLWFTP